MTICYKRGFIHLIVITSVIGVRALIGNLNAQGLLEEVRTGNKAAIESIGIVSCRVSLASPVSQLGPKGATIADYWQSADSWRYRIEEGGNLTDSVRHDFAVRRLSRNDARTLFVIERANADESPGRCDPYGCGLLKLCGPKGWPLTLDELLSRQHKVRQISRQAYQGHECVVLKLMVYLAEETPGEFEIWFDPKVNYLACKLIGESTIQTSKPFKSRRESQVLRFVEVTPGIYFPAETETKFYNDGTLAQHDVVTISDIRVNQPLAPNIFEMPIPPNATVIDRIRDREYKVDSQGKPTGSERSLPKGSPLPVSSELPSTIAQVETTAEARPFIRWILYGLLLVLASASIVWYIRRLRGSVTSG
jgi:hypothetical protein